MLLFTEICPMNNAAYFEQGIPFAVYMEQFERAVAEKRTSGPDQSEFMVHYTLLNLHRMQRLTKHTEIIPSLQQKIQAWERNVRILIITEFWCGDAAQNIPVIEKALSPNKHIDIRYVFRDEHPELMERYLTNGGRSIPKMIVMDAETGADLFTWGPRPAVAQAEMMRMKEAAFSKDTMVEGIQRWYIADKTLSMQAELETLFR